MINRFFISIVMTIFIACIFMIFLCICNRGFTKEQKIKFIALFSIVAFGNLLDLIINIIASTKDNSYEILLSCLYYISFMNLPLYILILVSIFREKKFRLLTFLIYVVCFFIFTILIGTGNFFGIDNELNIVKRWGYIIYIICVVLFLLYSFILMAISLRRIIGKYSPLLIGLLTLYMVSFILEFAITYTGTLYMLICFSSICLYVFCIEVWYRLDGLTGLLNQYTFLSDVFKIRPGEHLFVMDVDTFKEINDLHGHVKGDIVLKALSLVMIDTFNPYGRTYRIGGDEFAVILDRGVDPEEIRARFIDECANLHKSYPLFTSVSIGYLEYKGDIPIIEFVSMVDARMYINKCLSKAFRKTYLSEQNQKQTKVEESIAKTENE